MSVFFNPLVPFLVACIFDFFVYDVEVMPGTPPRPHTTDLDAPSPSVRVDSDVEFAAAATLLSPTFRHRVGAHVVGPLLARTMRGGLFALMDGDVAVPRKAIEIGAAGSADPETTALSAGGPQGELHPGFARTYETGVAGAVRWSVVEKVQGWPLRVLLGRRGLAFTGRRLAALGAEVADALDSCHRLSSEVRFVHGRLSVGHLMIDLTGRARIVGSPVPAGGAGLVPDAIGLGATLACAALASAPGPRALAPAAIRALAPALERPENAARVPVGLRRVIQSLLHLDARGFLPSMSVLRSEFIRHMGGLPMGVPDPAWGRALNDAVHGLPPEHRPTFSDAQWVVRAFAPRLPELVAVLAPTPPASSLVSAPPRLHLVHGAELPEARVDGPRPGGGAGPLPLLLVD